MRFPKLYLREPYRIHLPHRTLRMQMMTHGRPRMQMMLHRSSRKAMISQKTAKTVISVTKRGIPSKISETFRLSENRGKITLINLWASYSEDSLKGLNELNDLYSECKDSISVIAVQNHFGSKKVPDEIRDLDIPIATDNRDEEIYKLCGGSMAVPRTVILDRYGKVVYNRLGVLTKEELEDLLSSL